MQFIPITADGPQLGSVLGSMSATEERELRSALVGAGVQLVELARSVGGRVGWYNAGLELAWVASGQASITAAVSVVDSSKNAVDYWVELRPGWY